MSSGLVMEIVGLVIIFVAFGMAFYGTYKYDDIPISIFALVLIIAGWIIGSNGAVRYKQEQSLSKINKMQSYEVKGQYVTVYTEDTPVKYLIDPVTETVILVTSKGNVVLGETKEELFQNLKDKGFREYNNKGEKE